MNRRAFAVLVVIFVAAVGFAALIRHPAGPPPASQTPSATSSTTSRAPSSSSSAAPGQPPTTTATSLAPQPTLAPGTTVCDAYSKVISAGIVEAPDLVEASGVAAGRVDPTVIWAHNDSRAGPVAYAVGPNGEDLGSYRVAGAAAFDWEDMAAGPGPDPAASYLFFGDIGDNFGIRGGRITVYRSVEPPLSDPQLSAEVLALRYPQGEAPNAEGLMVDPVDGALYVVTRNREVTRVYAADGSASPGEVQDLTLVVSLALGAAVTGADISSDGTRIAFRGERQVWMWSRTPGQGLAEALEDPPCAAPSPEERQGESIGFTADASYVTISEGVRPALHRVPSAG